MCDAKKQGNRIAELEKALRPFAKLADHYNNFDPSDAAFVRGCVYVYQLRAARAALAAKEQQP